MCTSLLACSLLQRAECQNESIPPPDPQVQSRGADGTTSASAGPSGTVSTTTGGESGNSSDSPEPAGSSLDALVNSSPVVPSQGLSVKAGPLETERQAAYNLIQVAKEKGIGTQAYMSAFQFMENMVERGTPEDAIRARLDSILQSLKDQLERSDSIKSRPAGQARVGQINILAPGQKVPPNLVRYGGLDNPAALDMMKGFQNKFIDKLPKTMPPPDGIGTKAAPTGQPKQPEPAPDELPPQP